MTTSSIDQTKIDSEYPVAGVDNSTQGFRDNFAAIKESLGYAKVEINDLYANTARTDENTDFHQNNILNATLVGVTEKAYVLPIGEDADELYRVQYNYGNFQSFLIKRDITFELSNWLSDKFGRVLIGVRLAENHTTSHTINFIAGAGSTLYKTGNFPSSSIISSDTTIKVFEFSSSLEKIKSGTNSTQTSIIFARYLGDFSTTPSNSGIIESSINELSELSDVNFSSLQQGNILQFNGTSWVNIDLDNSAVEAETSARIAAIAEIDASIETETSARIAAIAEIDASIETETSARIAAINVETSARIAAINAETSARTLAIDSAMIEANSNIDAEVSARIASDTSLQQSINALSLNQLSNVDITDPQDNDILFYNSQNQKWVNNITTKHIVKIVDNGSLSQDVFEIDGVKLKSNTGVINRNIKFLVGQTYRFDVSDPSNSGFPLKFSTTPDTIVQAGNPPAATVTPYTTNVTNNYQTNPPGTAGSYIEITITASTPTLYLYAEESTIDTSKIGGEVQILVINEAAPVISNFIDSEPSISYVTVLPTASMAGVGGVVTATFPTQSYVPFPVGSTIKISGVTPVGYNTTATVLDAGTNFVKYANATTGAQTIAGKIEFAIPALGTATAAGTGSVATLTFAPQAQIPFPIGSTIKVAGVTPTTYNIASAVVIDAGVDFIKYTSAATGAQTVAGTIDFVTASSLVLPNGTAGQVKTLIMSGQTASTVVINVVNAGWKTSGSGTITFSAIGNTCTLQFINNKWYGTSNNGAVFA